MASVSGGDRIIVGVDFGTTFSGVAFTYSGNPESPDEIAVVKNWPGSNNVSSDKVPSELTYEIATSGVKRDAAGVPVPKRANDLQNVRWGLQIKQEQCRLSCLKLLLDRRQKLPEYVTVEDLTKLLVESGKTPEQAISDLLTLLYRHAKEELILRFGQQMVSTTHVHIVLTVPAVWTDAAKDATYRVAEKAGMGTNLHMISEPEAAAIYALRSMGQNQKLLKVGDNFIVCDAGGGTVDLISYEIRSLTPLRLEESAPGTGGICGGVFLNIRFRELIKQRIGADAFQALIERRPRALEVALRSFEDYVKKNFDPVDTRLVYDDNKFNIPLPGAVDNHSAGIDGGFISISTADVAEIFRPLVNEVIELVERQRNILSANGKTAKGVILVGGFGQSRYLYRNLRSRFADEDPPPTYTQNAADPTPENDGPRFLIIKPENSWTAVVRGAVLSGLERNAITSRKATRHYGVKCSMVFDPDKHSIKNKYWDDKENIWKARNQVEWHVKRGQSLPTTTPIRLQLFSSSDPGEGYPTSLKNRIVVSDAENLPSEFEENEVTRILCELDADLKKVPRKMFKRHLKRGEIYYKLNCEVGMQMESGRITFDLRVDHVVYGTVEAKYER